MAFIAITKSQINQHKRTGFIDIYLPIVGHKAIQYWWNDKDKTGEGFWESWQTGNIAWETADEAYLDAKLWAEAEEIPYVIHPELD